MRYQLEKGYPEELLDTNIASDYSKVRNIFKIQGQEEQFLGVINALITDGYVSARLTIQYSLQRRFDNDNLVSLLVYPLIRAS